MSKTKFVTNRGAKNTRHRRGVGQLITPPPAAGLSNVVSGLFAGLDFTKGIYIKISNEGLEIGGIDDPDSAASPSGSQ